MSIEKVKETTVEKVVSVSFYTSINIFDNMVSALNAERKDLTMTLNRQSRVLEVRHNDSRFAGKTVCIPFEALLSFCTATVVVK